MTLSRLCEHPNGAFEQVALMADISEILHEVAFADFGERRAADSNRTGIALVSAHQNGRNGRLAAAGFTYNGSKAAFGEDHIHTVEDLPVRGVGEMQIFAFDRAIRRNGLGFLLGFRQIQQPEDLVTCRHAVHGNMEEASQHPHGQEKVRCQQNDEDAAC